MGIQASGIEQPASARKGRKEKACSAHFIVQNNGDVNSGMYRNHARRVIQAVLPSLSSLSHARVCSCRQRLGWPMKRLSTLLIDVCTYPGPPSLLPLLFWSRKSLCTSKKGQGQSRRVGNLTLLPISSLEACPFRITLVRRMNIDGILSALSRDVPRKERRTR